MHQHVSLCVTGTGTKGALSEMFYGRVISRCQVSAMKRPSLCDITVLDVGDVFCFVLFTLI